jgi:hypothetical protein
MTKTNFDVTVVKGDPMYKEYPLEALDVYGDGEILPGMLVERTATGTVQPHSTATGVAAPVTFAVEERLFEGRGVNDAYDQNGEVVRVAVCSPGTEIYAWLAAGYDTNGENALLASNGDGTLRVSNTNPVARALQDVDNDPGTGGAPVRILVEVI